MSEETVQKKFDDSIWIRMMKRYAILMAGGLFVLVYIFPQLHEGASVPMLIGALLSGLATFGGAFGIAVSLFFHLWHQKK